MNSFTYIDYKGKVCNLSHFNQGNYLRCCLWRTRYYWWSVISNITTLQHYNITTLQLCKLTILLITPDFSGMQIVLNQSFG